MECIIFNKNANTWRRLLAIPVVAALFTLASALAGATGPAFAAPAGPCPSSQALGNFVVSSNVGAAFSNSNNTTTYKFFSLTNENLGDGVPGLIKYCVYPSLAQQPITPTTLTVQATGADGSVWDTKAGSRNFAFERPKGNPSNIPLAGNATDMGTANWNALPDNQTILLHINDPEVCAQLYGGTSPTCFVKPNPGLACNLGDTTVAYNAMPFGAVNCAKESFGVEAYDFNELGDEVTLEPDTGRELVSLNVLFASYACSVSGHWYTGDCDTTDGATFTMLAATNPITAKIYAVADCGGNPCPGALLATSLDQDFIIPYRPSADPDNCKVADGNDPSQWFNPLKDGGAGGCQYSISKVLTFTFAPGFTLPDNVIWTVQYNTTNAGYAPIGVTTCNANANNPGCLYDSLNVGTFSFPGAPYAGTDVAEGVAFQSWRNSYGGAIVPLQSITVYQNSADTVTTRRPLGEIITK
jgi:hypothetical protein